MLIRVNFFERGREVITNHPRTLSLKEVKMRKNIFSAGRGLLLGVMAVVLLLGLLGGAKAAPYYQAR